MAIVAVAGGTGNLGRAIVEAILARGKHEVKILSRKANPALEAELGAPIIVVDYTDVKTVTRVLEDNNIHTVISTLAMVTPTGNPPEVELIQAADASKTTKRMISSEWGVPFTKEHINQFPSVPPKLRAWEELQKVKNLETTVVHNGLFLDYYGMPAVKSYMTPMTLVLDIAHNTAAIPGSGDTPVVFTHTFDVAKFVAASLDLPKWDPASYVIGDKVTCNQFLKLAEDIKGTKFDVTYDSVEKLKSGQITELPAHLAAYQFMPKEMIQGLGSIFGLWFETGVFNLTPGKTLNDAFPEIETMKVKGLLEAAWKSS